MSQNTKLGTYDVLTVLEDGASALASSKAGYVNSSAMILDVGQARLDARAIVNVLEIAKKDTTATVYKIAIQGSTSSAFDSDMVDLAVLTVGSKDGLPGNVDLFEGQYELPFTNVTNNVVRRYIRVYMTKSGSDISPAATIKYTCHLVP